MQFDAAAAAQKRLMRRRSILPLAGRGGHIVFIIEWDRLVDAARASYIPPHTAWRRLGLAERILPHNTRVPCVLCLL